MLVDKVSYHPQLVQRDDLAALVAWLLQEPARINKLSLKARLTQTERLAYE